MKINRIIFFLFAGVLLSGLMMGTVILGKQRITVPTRIDQNEAPTNDSYVGASISKGTILLLLAVGVIGALGVSRKRKGSGSDSHRNPADQVDQDINVNEDRKKLTSRNS
jgi:hypothetical protein